MNPSNQTGEKPIRLFFGSFFSSEKKEHVTPLKLPAFQSTRHDLNDLFNAAGAEGAFQMGQLE